MKISALKTPGLIFYSCRPKKLSQFLTLLVAAEADFLFDITRDITTDVAKAK